MKNLKSFYRNKKVLITGHTGFKGSWLTIWLNELGASVTGVSLDPVTERDLFNLAGLNRKVTDYRQDIRDLVQIKKIFDNEQPEIVFHLAAQALVIPGYSDPIATFSTNIMGTSNIIEACRNTPAVRQIVIITTDKVYENREVLTGYREGDPLGGYDPYSASKAAAEIIIQSYRQSFFQSINQPINQSIIHSTTQSIASARAGNVIGGGDWSGYRLVPDCIRSLEADDQILVRNPESVRPWQHVLEPLSGYLLLGMKLAEDPIKYSGAWNFGPEETDVVTVKDVVERIIKYWGKGEWQAVNTREKPHEAGILRLDITKSKNDLGWKPVLNTEQAIELTADWYKNYASNDPYKLCSEQIIEYSELWNSKNSV